MILSGVPALICPGGDRDATLWGVSCDTYPPVDIAMAANAFIQRGKSVGWWQYCDVVRLYASHELSPLGVVLKGGPVELDGNLTQVPRLGISSDGTTASYIDELFVLSSLANFKLNNNFDLEFITNDNTQVRSGDSGANGSYLHNARYHTGSTAIYYNCSSTAVQMTVSTAAGLGGTLRTNASTVYTIKDKTFLNSSCAAAGFPTSTLRRCRNGTTSGCGTVQHGIALLGGFAASMSDAAQLAMVADISDACRQFFSTLGTLTAIDVPPTPPFTGPYYFTQPMLAASDIGKAGKMVIKVITPPVDTSVTNANYAYWPYTAVTGRTYGGFATAQGDPNVPRYEYLGYNRASGVPGVRPLKGSDTMGTITVGGRQGRVRFTTYPNSKLATEIQVAHAVGLLPRSDPAYLVNGTPTGWLDIAQAGGIDTSAWDALLAASSNPATDPNFVSDVNISTGKLMHWAYANASAASLFTQTPTAGGNYLEAPDIFILGRGRLCDLPVKPAGFYLDFEADDDDTPANVVAHLQRLQALCASKGYNFIVMPDDLTQSGASCGYTQAFGNQMIAAPYATGIPVARNTMDAAGGAVAAIQRQLALLTGPNQDQPIPYNKILIQVNMGAAGQEITQQQAQDLHDYVLSSGVLGVGIFNQGAIFAAPGTAVCNLRQATLLGIPQATS